MDKFVLLAIFAILSTVSSAPRPDMTTSSFSMTSSQTGPGGSGMGSPLAAFGQSSSFASNPAFGASNIFSGLGAGNSFPGLPGASFNPFAQGGGNKGFGGGFGGLGQMAQFGQQGGGGFGGMQSPFGSLGPFGK